MKKGKQNVVHKGLETNEKNKFRKITVNKKKYIRYERY